MQAAAAGDPGLLSDSAEGQEHAAVPAVPTSLPRPHAGSALERMAAEASVLHSTRRRGHCVPGCDLLPPAVMLNGGARRGRPPGRVPPDMQKQAGMDKAGSCEVRQQEAARVRLHASLPFGSATCSLTLRGCWGLKRRDVCQVRSAETGGHCLLHLCRPDDINSSCCAGLGALPDFVCRPLWLCQQHHDHMQQDLA